MSPEAVDINFLRGLVIILLMLAFAGIWAWAWSRKRKAVFHAASMLPLEEDEGLTPQNDSKTEGIKE